MNKKIILITGVLVVIFALFFIAKNISFAPTVTPITEENNLPINNQIKPQFPDQTLPLSNAPKDVAWAVFQKYLGYNRDQNLDGVRSVVYRVASVCKTRRLLLTAKPKWVWPISMAVL